MEIHRNVPLIEQLKTILLERIQAGAYSAGTRFPSEAELCDEFGVSRATIRTVLADLTARGMIVRQAGVGTFLSSTNQLKTGLERLESVLSVARRQGLRVSMDCLNVRTIYASEAQAARFRVPAGAPLTFVTRSIRVEGELVSHHEDFVPAQWMSEKRMETFTGSVLDWLTAHHPHQITAAVTEITAINAGEELAANLGVVPGVAVILLKETLHDDTGTVIDFSNNYFVPDRFDLQFVRRR